MTRATRLNSTVRQVDASAAYVPTAAPSGVEGSDTLFALADPTGRYALRVAGDGTTTIPKLALTPTIQSQLTGAGAGAQLQPMNPETSYPYAITDVNGRVAFAIGPDGSAVIPKYTIPSGSVTSAQLAPAVTALLMNPTPDTVETIGSSPSRVLWRNSQSTGQRTVLRSTGDNYNGRVMPDNAILWETDTGPLWVPSSGGTPAPVYPTGKVIACWGDSLTAGWPTSEFTDPANQSWPGVLNTLVPSGWSTYNGGVTGQSAQEIALREGGLTISVTVAGGTIPASGAVTVTTNQIIGWRLDRTWSCVGTLAGVAGTLSRTTSDDAYTLHFTPTSTGSAVATSGAILFTSTAATTYQANVAIVFAGRNDIGYTSAAGDIVTRTVAATVAMVNRLTPYVKRVLLVGTTTAVGETSGSTNYIAVTSINTQLSALYPGRFYDLRHYLVAQVIYDLGITPTATDLTNMAGDTLPPSIMTSGDSVHYSKATAAKVAAAINTQLTAKGWLS